MVSQIVWQGNNSMFFEGDHDLFFFCLDKKYTVQVYIGQNVQVTCASVRMRPHKHTNKQDGTQLQVNIHQKDCAKNVFTSENWKNE